MKTEDLLLEDIMLSPDVLTELDDYVKFNIIPLLTTELRLTRRESRQAATYIQNKILDNIGTKPNRI